MKADLAAFLAATVVASLPTACAEAPHGRSTAETVGVGVERRTVALGIATDTAAKRSHARTFAVGSGEPGEDHLHWQGGPHQFLDYRGNSHRLFWDARHVGGLDRLEPGDGSIPKGPGADSVNTLFYLGHGYPHSWDIGSKSAELAKAGFGDHRLRYLLMCSCNVMEHAYLASAQQLQPTHVLGSVSNHFDRWVASETGAPLGRGLRLACGGATKVCSEFKKPALRTWDWILNKGYPIADAWVLGLSIGGRRSICLSWGTEDARSLPLLTDFDFGNQAAFSADPGYVFSVYPVTRGRRSVELHTNRSIRTLPVIPVLPSEQASAAQCEAPGSAAEPCSFYDRRWQPKLIPWNQAVPLARRLEIAERYARDRGLQESSYDTISTDLVVDRVSTRHLGGTAGDLKRYIKGTVVRFRRQIRAGPLVPTSGLGGEFSVLVDATGEVRAFSRVWRPIDRDRQELLTRQRTLLGEQRAVGKARRTLGNARYHHTGRVFLAYKEHQAPCVQDALEPYYYVEFEPTGQHAELPAQEIEVYGFRSGRPRAVDCSRPQHAP